MVGPETFINSYDEDEIYKKVIGLILKHITGSLPN